MLYHLLNTVVGVDTNYFTEYIRSCKKTILKLNILLNRPQNQYFFQSALKRSWTRYIIRLQNILFLTTVIHHLYAVAYGIVAMSEWRIAF